MSDEPENVVLILLRRIDTKIDDLRADITEVKQRLTTLEIQIGNLVGTEQSHYAQVMLRMDRHDARLSRIERRLDIVEAPAG